MVAISQNPAELTDTQLPMRLRRRSADARALRLPRGRRIRALLEDFGVPVPGEVLLISAALFAGAGHMNIAGVIVVAVIGAIIGDNVGYAVGRLGGRPFAERWGRYVFLTPGAARSSAESLLRRPRRQDRHRRPVRRGLCARSTD